LIGFSLSLTATFRPGLRFLNPEPLASFPVVLSPFPPPSGIVGVGMDLVPFFPSPCSLGDFPRFSSQFLPTFSGKHSLSELFFPSELTRTPSFRPWTTARLFPPCAAQFSPFARGHFPGYSPPFPQVRLPGAFFRDRLSLLPLLGRQTPCYSRPLLFAALLSTQGCRGFLLLDYQESAPSLLSELSLPPHRTPSSGQTTTNQNPTPGPNPHHPKTTKHTPTPPHPPEPHPHISTKPPKPYFFYDQRKLTPPPFFHREGSRTPRCENQFFG